ncbi:MAG: aldo/keto reductase, partial [Clostridiales bacterium]|nr:aldo/keto reductase [Clostridiales bacterium]
ECGLCMTRCPYGLNIPELLKKNLADYRNILSGKTKVL